MTATITGDYLTASPRTRELLREQRVLAVFAVTGSMGACCIHCGAPFTQAKSARRHMATSKKCRQTRQVFKGFP